MLPAILSIFTEDITGPTAGLGFYHAKHTNESGNTDVAYIWEIAGSTQLSELIAVPITPQRIHTAIAIIVVDASAPVAALQIGAAWCRLLTERVDACIGKLQAKQPAAVTQIRQATRARLCQVTGADAPADDGATQPLAIPTLIVAQHWDALRDAPSAQQQLVAGALRTLAHSYGAGCMACSTKDASTISHVRAWLASRIFAPEKTPAVPLQTGSYEPCCVVEGADSFAAIPAPPGAAAASPWPSSASAWLDALRSHWPSSAAAPAELTPAGTGAASTDAAAWAEPAVDEAVQQRAEARARYAREAERRLKAEARATAAADAKRKKKRAA